VSYNDSSLLLHHLKRLDEAKTRLLQSIELAKDQKSKISEAHSRANLARLLLKMDDKAKARAEFERSAGVLAAVNQQWDERKRNQDTTPLDGNEIASLMFDKSWLASVATEYGQLLYTFNQQQDALKWLHLALDVSKEIRDYARVKYITELLEFLQKLNAQGSGTASATFQSKDSFYTNPSRFAQISYIDCASCGYSYEVNKRNCPRCTARTCRHCGQLARTDDEFCEYCDYWIG
jgi:tetratricopeptide (TPR) repeat protein